MGGIRYYRKVNFLHDFSPEEHEWLAVSGWDHLFVRKSSDRWTSTPRNFEKRLEDFVAVPTSDVPADIRRKAGQRLGAHRAAVPRLSRA